MSPIEKNVEAIKILMQSGDVSDSMHLRSLHSELCRALTELDKNLAKCSLLIKNGALIEAKRLNCSFAVSLTQTAESLEFSQRDEFLEICRDYGLDMPPLPDKKLLAALSSPVRSGDRHLHMLLQDYKKIGRNGSKKERIALLRLIVEKLPDASRYRKDLMETELARFQEIENEVNSLEPGRENLDKLEKLYFEIMSPDYLQRPKETLTKKIHEKLLPLQQEKLKMEVEGKLQELEELYIARDMEGLRNAFGEWEVFSSNPLIRMTSAEKQTVSDIKNFLAASNDEEKAKKEHEALVWKLEEKLAENCSFSEIAGEYNLLLLHNSEFPVSGDLMERLENLKQEAVQTERYRNIRRCAYGTAFTVLAITVIFSAVFLTQHFLAVKSHWGNMKKLMGEGEYEEVIKLYASLQKNVPRIAKNAKLLALYHSALQHKEQKKLEIQKKKEAFAGLLKQLRELAAGGDMLDNAKMIDQNLAGAKKLMADQDSAALEAFRKLEVAITTKRTQLKKEREKRFLDDCRSEIGSVEKMIASLPGENLAVAEGKLKMAAKRFEQKIDIAGYVPEHLKKQAKIDFENICKRFDAAVAKEKLVRLVKMPENFEAYLRGLEEIRYKDVLLAAEYRNALKMKEIWKNEYDCYMGNIPTDLESVGDLKSFEEGLIKSDLQRILPLQQRSASFAEFFRTVQKLDLIYEIKLTSKDGLDYFFYTDKKPVVEHLRRPKRINITFISAVDNDALFTLKYDYSDKNMPYKLITKPSGLTYFLPSEYSALGGKKVFQDVNELKNWAGADFARKYKILNSDGPGVYINLQNALLELVEKGDEINPYLREILILKFLEELNRISRLHPELTRILDTLKSYQDSRKVSWQSPQRNGEYQKDREKLREMYANMNLGRCFEAGKIRGDFVCAFHARKLLPVAVVQQVVPGGVKLHKFRKNVPEAMVLYDGKMQLLSSGFFNGKIIKSDLPLLFSGQVIWGFADGRKTVDFVNEWKRKAIKLNVKLHIRPSICPSGITL